MTGMTPDGCDKTVSGSESDKPRPKQGLAIGTEGCRRSGRRSQSSNRPSRRPRVEKLAESKLGECDPIRTTAQNS